MRNFGQYAPCVIRHDLPDLFSSKFKLHEKKAGESRQYLQQEIAGLAENSRLIVAEKSGHAIQVDQPELVVNTIREMVENIRSGG